MPGIGGLPLAADLLTLVTDEATVAAATPTNLGAMTIPEKSTWFVQQLVVNLRTAIEPTTVELYDTVAGDVFCRLHVTDSGAFALDNQGWPVSGQIGPNRSSTINLAIRVIDNAGAVDVSASLVLCRAHDNPVEVHPAS